MAFWRKKSVPVGKAPRQRSVSVRESGSLLRKLPWIEAIGTAVGASTLYFVLHKNELAEMFAIAGALVTLGRLGYAAEMERSIAELKDPLDQIKDYFDVSSQAHFGVFRDMLQVYGKIVEPEFSRVKDGILGDARSRLLDLANDKKSVVLPTTTYYGWLLPMLEKVMPPEKIWALSMMREPEWTESQPERNFIELSNQASVRGVPIDRVFVVGRDAVAINVNNPAIKFHLHSEHPKGLRGYVVEESVVKSDDEELYSKLGDGFIAFGERVALVDVFTGRSARGYVTMNPVEIARLKEVYDRLQILAEPLDSYILRHAKAGTIVAGDRNRGDREGLESSGALPGTRSAKVQQPRVAKDDASEGSAPRPTESD